MTDNISNKKGGHTNTRVAPKKDKDSDNESNDLQFEGGDSPFDFISSNDTTFRKGSILSLNLSMVVIALNILFSPFGTFLAALKDQRGTNDKLMVIGVLNLIGMALVVYLWVLYGHKQSLFDSESTGS